MYTGYLIKYNEEGEAQSIKFLDTSLDIEQLNLASAKLLKESGKAGSFTFSVPVTHFSYEEWTKITSYVDLYENGTLIFSGRVYSIDADFQMNLEIICEGMMAVLNDTLFEPIAYRGPLNDLLEQIMTSHNDQVGPDKQILIGDVEYEEEEIVKEYDEYTSTLERLFDLVETFGGFMVVRKEEGGLYLDWLNPDDADEITQKIEFAENLLDITQNESADEVITVLYPMGAERDVEEEDPDLESTTEFFSAENASGSTEGVTYQLQSPPKSKSTVTLNYEIYKLSGVSRTDTLGNSSNKAVSTITYTIAGTPVENSQITFSPTIKWVDGSYTGNETFGGTYSWVTKTIPFAKTIQGSQGNKWIVRGIYKINTTSRTIYVEIRSIKIQKTGKSVGNKFMFTGGTIKYYTSYAKTSIDTATESLEWFDQTILDGNTTIEVRSSSNTINISNTADGCVYEGSVEYKIDPDYQYETERSENFSFRSVPPSTMVTIYPKHRPTPETMVELGYEIGVDGEACSETIAAIAPSASVASFTKTLTYDPKNRTNVLFAPGIGVEVKGGNPTTTISINFLWENGTYNFSKTFRYSTDGTKVTVQGKCSVNTANRTIKFEVTSIYNVTKKTWIKPPKIYVTGGSVAYSTTDPDYVDANTVEKRTRYLVWKDQTWTGETTVTVNVSQNKVTIVRVGNKPYRYDGYISYKTEIDDPRLKDVRRTVTVEKVESKEVEYNNHTFSHTEGDKFIVDATAVEEYGYIAGYESFSEITNPDKLFEEGYKYLSKVSHSRLAVSVNAIDLVNAGYAFEKFDIDKRVHVISVPHNIDRKFVISKVEVDLFDRSQSTLTLDEEVEGYIGRTRHASNKALELINHIYKNYALNKSMVSLSSTVLSHTTSILQNEYEISLKASSIETREWINTATNETIVTLQEYTNSAIEIRDNEISLISESMEYENKIPFPYYDIEANTLVDGNKYINHGVTWTWNTDDNTVKATGYASNDSQFKFSSSISNPSYFAAHFKLNPGDYTLSGCPENGSDSTYYLVAYIHDKNLNFLESIIDYGEGGVHFELTDERYIGIRATICRDYNIGVNGLVFKPMLELGTQAHSYRDPAWGAKKMVSEINITPGLIKISANKINLEGAITITELNSSLKTVDSLDGVTRINGGKIATGTIKARQIDVNDLNVNGHIVLQSELNTATSALYENSENSSYIYHTATASGPKPNPPSTWISPTEHTTVGTDGKRYGNQNEWTRIRPKYDSSYPVCWITRQYLAGNNVGFVCDPVWSDETTTIIDGGHIITGTVSANYIDINGIITNGGIAILSDVSAAEGRASATATTYIAANATLGGVDFRPWIGSTSYLNINSNGISIYKSGVLVASYGNEAQIGYIGTEDSPWYNVRIASSSLEFRKYINTFLTIGYNYDSVTKSAEIRSAYNHDLDLYSSKGAWIGLDRDIMLMSSSGTGSSMLLTNTYTTISTKTYFSVDADSNIGLNASTGYVVFRIAKNAREVWFEKASNGAYVFMPSPDDTIYLGGSSHRWKTVYSTSGSISTSDRNLKHDIHDIPDEYDELFDLIKPKTYMYDNGDRVHIGAISQDIEVSLSEVGLTAMDFGGFCKDVVTAESTDKNPICVNGGHQYIYGLRYEEFIMLNTWQIQKLKTRVSKLEQLIQQLKGE